MTITATTSVRWTVADLKHLPDSNGTRYEIISGELFMAKQPHWHHQQTCSNLHGRLFIWNLESGLGKVVEGPGVIFSDEDAVAPDLVWVSNKRLAVILGDDGKLHGPPELVIEVLSYPLQKVGAHPCGRPGAGARPAPTLTYGEDTFYLMVASTSSVIRNLNVSSIQCEV